MMCGEWQIFMFLTGLISVLSKLLPEVKDLRYAIKVKALLLCYDQYVLSTLVLRCVIPVVLGK